MTLHQHVPASPSPLVGPPPLPLTLFLSLLQLVVTCFHDSLVSFWLGLSPPPLNLILLFSRSWIVKIPPSPLRMSESNTFILIFAPPPVKKTILLWACAILSLFLSFIPELKTNSVHCSPEEPHTCFIGGSPSPSGWGYRLVPLQLAQAGLGVRSYNPMYL